MSTPIRVIVQTFTSERDRNGNCYHFAIFTNPLKGRHATLAVEVGGESNADHMAFRLAGEDWEGTFCTHSTLPKREWNRVRKNCAVNSYEGDPHTKASLCALFEVKPSTLDR